MEESRSWLTKNPIGPSWDSTKWARPCAVAIPWKWPPILGDGCNTHSPTWRAVCADEPWCSWCSPLPPVYRPGCRCSSTVRCRWPSPSAPWWAVKNRGAAPYYLDYLRPSHTQQINRDTLIIHHTHTQSSSLRREKNPWKACTQNLINKMTRCETMAATPRVRTMALMVQPPSTGMAIKVSHNSSSKNDDENFI